MNLLISRALSPMMPTCERDRLADRRACEASSTLP